MKTLDSLRHSIRLRYQQTEPEIVAELLAAEVLSERERSMLVETAAATVARLREQNNPTLMESFLSEYGLSTREGIGLMCLAEALLRVPDAATVDELIADKIEPSNWGIHLGKSSSSLVNASTWALLLTGRLLDDSLDGVETDSPVLALRQLIKRLGEPVVRKSVSQAMKMLGKQFVLGQTIEDALQVARELEQKGYIYSYDMLGEAARTHADAERYFEAYADAIALIAQAPGEGVTGRPGISVKLSALHPRYEHTHKAEVMDALLPRISALVDAAAEANIGLNIDAEESDRLDLSLDVIEALLQKETIRQWDGFGVVVQAYGRRALPVIDWLLAVCESTGQRIMVRLVKGAYWDAEIKQAQELGLANFPVYTRKATTDVSYLVCAQRLLNNRHSIYPQFATHNAHTVSAIRYMAGSDTGSYEFQRLHGMGEALHDDILQRHGTRCRIYAPVGAHVDLLAYLVRRLLENGANSSFVNQIVNEELSPMEVARCPIDEVATFETIEHPAISKPLELFYPQRANSRGYRINDPASIQPLLDARAACKTSGYEASPMLAGESTGDGTVLDIVNPARPDYRVGSVVEASLVDVEAAVQAASATFTPWQSSTARDRSECLLRAAVLYEENIAEFSTILAGEAGKHLLDAISEVREAVDFLRYYAQQAMEVSDAQPGRGVIVCISPWNFPLAIFTGQIAAALAAGNTVLAKPARQSPLVAAQAVALLHRAAIPASVLQLLPGDGPVIGNALVSHAAIAGVCFTGSTAVAKQIERQLAARTESDLQAAGSTPDPLLIAETGGLNAMIADTTALTEQVVRDILISSFQSAGQRCSALRMLYIQEEAEQRLVTMLCGALQTLTIGDPWELSTDIGPVIDAEARDKISNYIKTRDDADQLVTQLAVPDQGYFIGPAIIRVSGIEELDEEIFGPVLHIATYKAAQLDSVLESINNKGYGLTFGLHTRIDDRVQYIVDRIKAGNIYVNRNQIGAVVGAQPFGGEGLSGTGPKAGGPHYLQRFYAPLFPSIGDTSNYAGAVATAVPLSDLQQAIESVTPMTEPLQPQHKSQVQALQQFASGVEIELNTIEIEWLLPGPTGESNRLSVYPRGRVLIIGDNPAFYLQQCADAFIAGCAVVLLVSGNLDSHEETLLVNTRESALPFTFVKGVFDPALLESVENLAAVAVASDAATVISCKQALALREGAIVPVICECGTPGRYVIERHVCIDTTAAGGNATLLAASE
ncbi:bifunctional proline dehydrogenase/L-glutamate gamma-semialdehyde dehydrogenase [Chromatiales bacterium (ex Bugula neritina AB1)]|nr:bifunctional proline dehydrogenase/L-glutamate gamma-semialdehyde dehydrogenase [Chromatiales bacterium (ex Bugula neritina AB1)]